jgi:hypothetical protein
MGRDVRSIVRTIAFASYPVIDVRVAPVRIGARGWRSSHCVIEDGRAVGRGGSNDHGVPMAFWYGRRRHRECRTPREWRTPPAAISVSAREGKSFAHRLDDNHHAPSERENDRQQLEAAGKQELDYEFRSSSQPDAGSFSFMEESALRREFSHTTRLPWAPLGGLSETSWSVPGAGFRHHEFGLDLEAILFVSLHGPSHLLEEGLGSARIMPIYSQRPNTLSLYV